MIKLTAEINLIETVGTSLNGVEGNLYGNNISSPIESVLGQTKRAINPFIIGASKIGEGATIESSVDYFIGNQLSSENGTFSSPYTMTVSGSGIDHFTIAFDTANKRHPNSIVFDGVTYYDDDSIFTVANLSNSNSHTITIDNWNSPRYPLVITGIYVGLKIDIDYSVLQNLEIKHKDRASNETVSYGIISNTGTMTFVDRNGEIKDYAEQQLLKSDLKVQIFLKDTLSKKTTLVGKYETSDWDYDTANREVTVQLKDNLELMQEINDNGIDLERDKNGYVITTKTAKDLYVHLLVQSGGFNFKQFYALDVHTQERLTNTVIGRYYLESGSLWQQWTKLCELVQAHIWQDFDGMTNFKAV